ncbi:MAG: isoamylase early set domain-containing protein [Chloroflexota bacterium]
MIHKTKSSIPGHVRIVFELPSSVWANRVSVLGEFNDWQDQQAPLSQDRDGQWRTALDLPAGRQYEFLYLVDGQSLIDIQADGLSDGAYHEQKSIVSTALERETVGHQN